MAVAGCLVVITDLHARHQIGAVDTSVTSVDHRVRAVQSQLTAARHRLTAVQARSETVTRAFDAAQSSLSATQATLSKDEDGLQAQGVDLGVLNTCLSGVQDALNQFAVGQTSGGLASLRASTRPCAALDTGGSA
jgi:hypothetical protein